MRARKSLFTVINLLCLTTLLNAQNFSFKMFFEDAEGNRDTIEMGLDSQATGGIDSQFGEVNIIEESYQDEIDVRITDRELPKLGEVTYHTKKQIVNGGIMEIIVRTDHFPVTASWDREKFTSTDRIPGGIFTSINPGGWFDTGSPSDLGIVVLSKQDSVTFSSNIKYGYSEHYGYIHKDTMPSYWFVFAPESIINHVHEPILNEQISIYPNPAGDYIMIENGSDKKIEEIGIFNNHGQLVSFSSEEKISLNNQSPGVYFLQIKTGDGRFVTKKVVKK